ncbi:hypothetical protein SCLCIDRAFT_31710 [Scleroderma citrinum Foug A]|uniref:Uncharacterized protein n=1 Tax=Scleroderma citrinum Foug A TaxID=1036808 RepID=A0A0C2ZM13_9AGAM|nr:hypothetical protein SCLCIDRAFT_31710 [Scleroderma citrinum Foug A]
MDVFSHFGRLDELIRMVYQGFDRFVVLSHVNESAWTIHLALKGPAGRWWRGSWSAQDVLHIVGKNASSQVLDSFAQKLSETFVKGELSIGNWSPEKGTNLNLTLGPTSKKPLHIPLVELSPTEAAAYATALLSEIALQAQPRNCRLNPPIFPSVTALNSPRANTCAYDHHQIKKISELSVATVHSSTKKDTKESSVANVPLLPAEAQQKIQALEAELAQTKAQKAKSKSPPSESGSKLPAASRTPKGNSLANPHKKARKYQALEFGSDDE